MNKLNLGTIGTSWITDSFIEAALATDSYELKSIYSRSAEKGKEFAKKYGDIDVETDLEKFMTAGDLDVIYIASPNSLHYQQALRALQAKKHVMVEKPASLNVEEWDEMVETAATNGVFILEAARHMHAPNLEKIATETQKLGNIYGATFPYMKYSSRYDNVLAGEEPNIFSLDFAGGALMDLGIYPVYTAVALFGEPEDVLYIPHKIQTGVDGMGTAILRYENFDVTILVGKIASSLYEAEIYGENQTLIIDHVAEFNQARLLDVRDFTEEELKLEKQHKNQMFYEAETLAQMIANKDTEETQNRYKELTNQARIVTKTLYHLRKQAGIIFTSEK